jgi:hypothetical protein
MPLILALLSVILTLAACSSSEQLIARERQPAPRVTPTALATVPEGIEGTTLTITDATFETEQLLLQEDEPTVLTVVNRDNRAYCLLIEQLVDGQPIDAATTTHVNFTTPEVGPYAGQLLEAISDTVLASLRVVVEAASGAPRP